MDVPLIDEQTELGARAARHLREDIVVWLTTVSPAGAPLPMPVWFLWDGAASVTVYTFDGLRVRNLRANPRVALNFDGDGKGGDIVVLSGRATFDDYLPAARDNPPYLDKYANDLPRIGYTPAEFSASYDVRLRIDLSKLRGF